MFEGTAILHYVNYNGSQRIACNALRSSKQNVVVSINGVFSVRPATLVSSLLAAAPCGLGVSDRYWVKTFSLQNTKN